MLERKSKTNRLSKPNKQQTTSTCLGKLRYVTDTKADLTHPQYTLERKSKTEGDSTRGRDISEQASKVRAGRSMSRKGYECLVTNGGYGAYGTSNIMSTARNIGTKQRNEITSVWVERVTGSRTTHELSCSNIFSDGMLFSAR